MLKMYSTTQFKHTNLWNNIIDHVKKNIDLKRHRSGIKYFDNCFSGAEFVDILYEYLLTKQAQFEKLVTKEKAVKLSQSIMESGVFESVNGYIGKFENTTTRLYRFKSTAIDSSDENFSIASMRTKHDNNKENVISVPKSSSPKTNYYEIASLRKMLDYLREKPKNTENDRHNSSYERVTREVILEKLLTLIDLPILEYFLVDSKSTNAKSSNVDDPSLLILEQIFDVTKSDANEEWKFSAHSCLDYTGSSDTNFKSLSDAELYALIREFYSKQRSFFNIVFTPLFANILLLIRHGCYSKALDTLNLGTLLLSKPTQAELKRLLKFLYLTSNNTSAPKLSIDKPNNIIVLNHFANCLFKAKTFTFEESRLILNFMFNNFDYLFTLPKNLQEIVNKRLSYVQRYGTDVFLEKQYCKRVTQQQYVDISKDLTKNSLIQLANSLIDDASISLKEKKAKLRLFQINHPDLYQEHFADLF